MNQPSRRKILVGLGAGAVAVGMGPLVASALGLRGEFSGDGMPLQFDDLERLADLLTDTPLSSLPASLVKEVKAGTSLERLVAAFGGEIQFGRSEPAHEFAYLRLWERPGEATDRLTVLEGDDRRYSLNPELHRQFLILVDVDLGELPGSTALIGEPFERWSQYLAGAAPLRPEVDDHGDLV